jgi:hypothetical protein
MSKRLKPGEAPAEGDLQPREARPKAESAAKQQRRRKEVDQELSRDRPVDERLDGLTGKYLA